MIKRSTLLTVALIILVAAVVGTLARLITKPDLTPFTEFYLLNDRGQAADYPKKLTAGQSQNVIVGIINHEHATTRYSGDVVSGDATVGEFGPLVLDSGGKIEQTVAFHPEMIGTGQTLFFRLFRDDGTDPYLTLQLVVDVRAP